MRLLSIFYCVASLRRASKNVWKRGVALASIFIYATFVFGQVGTVYKVDGVAPNSLQSVYSSPTFRGGEIDWNLPPGATTSYFQDMFLNTATVPAPTIAFPTSCGLTGIVSGNLSVFVVEYDAWGNWQSSPVVQQNIPSSPAGCYSVTWSTQMFSGFNAAFSASSSQYAVFALVCAAACTPPISATLQFGSTASTGSVTMFSSTVPTTPTTTYYGYTTAASSVSIAPCASLNGTSQTTKNPTCPTGITQPVSDQGLEIGNTTIQVNTNGGTLVHFPTTIPWDRS